MYQFEVFILDELYEQFENYNDAMATAMKLVREGNWVVSVKDEKWRVEIFRYIR